MSDNITVSQALPFVKMHGIGNDFVVVDGLHEDFGFSQEEIQAHSVLLCDRRFGVGGDGVILILPSERADFRMRMFNPDGSEAEMCGNGIRCEGKYLYDSGHTDKREVSVDTMGGVMVLSLHVDDATNTVNSVTVNMGKPGRTRGDLPMTGEGEPRDVPIEVGGETVRITGVSMGNPHVVFFTDNATDETINRLGPLLETHPLFPKRTNVHLVQVHSREEVTMLTWERGAGRTLACGTGACAVAVACAWNGLTERAVLAHLPGGDLRIEWCASDDCVYMTGAAATVFAGEFDLS